MTHKARRLERCSDLMTNPQTVADLFVEAAQVGSSVKKEQSPYNDFSSKALPSNHSETSVLQARQSTETVRD